MEVSNMDKLERLLNSEIISNEIDEKSERNHFSYLYVTKQALQKARIYAELSKDYSGSNIECYGYALTDPNKKNRIIEDVYYAPDQTNTSAHTLIPSEAVLKAARDIKQRGKKVIGWWHSHANFGTFHSGTDDQNHRTVLDQIAASNYIQIYHDLAFLDENIKKTKSGDSTVYVCDRNNSAKRLELFFNELVENPLNGTSMDKLVVRLPMKISYAYSMVVNARRSPPYAEIATIEFCSTCSHDEYEAKEVPVRVLDYPTDIEIDAKEMKKEVRSKLVLPQRKIIVPVKYRFEKEKSNNSPLGKYVEKRGGKSAFKRLCDYFTGRSRDEFVD